MNYNTILKLIIAFTLIISISSCSENDNGEPSNDNNGNNTVSLLTDGNWILDSGSVNISGAIQSLDYEHTPECNQDFVKFYENGTLEQVFYTYNGTVCSGDVYSSTYELTDSEIILSDFEIPFELPIPIDVNRFEIEQLTNNILIIGTDVQQNGITARLSLKMIKE